MLVSSAIRQFVRLAEERKGNLPTAKILEILIDCRFGGMIAWIAKDNMFIRTYVDSGGFEGNGQPSIEG